MPKPYSDTPVLLPGRSTYTANFRACNGQRVCRSLGTDDASLAGLLCAGLVRCKHSAKHVLLWRAGNW
jgi:hypothetical protein